MTVATTVPFRLAAGDLEALGLGDREVLELDLEQVTIQEAVEIQRRVGVTPRGLVEGLRTLDDAAALLAGVWLALRQAGAPRGWHEIDFRVYPGKGSSDDEPEPSTSD